MSKTKVLYSTTLKLSPAIGDWTTIQYRDTDLDDIEITPVQNVNFDSLTKAQMHDMHYLHYELAMVLAEQFSTDMDIKIELHSVTASQLTYQDFLNSQKDYIVQSDYAIKDVGRVNVIFEHDLADMVVNRLTGGKGETSEEKEFTELEAKILQTQMKAIQTHFASAWQQIFTPTEIDMDFLLGEYKENKKLSLRETFVTFTVHLFFGKGELKKMVWAYPNSVIRKLIERKEQLHLPIQPNIALKKETMEKLKIPVKVTLGRAQLNLQEIQRLQVGDVITLDSRFDQPLQCEIGNRMVLNVQPGVSQNKIGLQVLGPYESKNIEMIKRNRPEPLPPQVEHAPEPEPMPETDHAPFNEEEPQDSYDEDDSSVPSPEPAHQEAPAPKTQNEQSFAPQPTPEAPPSQDPEEFSWDAIE